MKDSMMQNDDYDVVKNQMTEGDLKNKMPKHAVDTCVEALVSTAR